MFKIGDKVRIVDALYGAPAKTIGKEGTISRVERRECTYEVRFDEEYNSSYGWWYSLEELELAYDLEIEKEPTFLEQALAGKEVEVDIDVVGRVKDMKLIGLLFYTGYSNLHYICDENGRNVRSVEVDSGRCSDFNLRVQAKTKRYVVTYTLGIDPKGSHAWRIDHLTEEQLNIRKHEFHEYKIIDAYDE